jgi:MFS family permease
VGLAVSALFVRDTAAHVELEQRESGGLAGEDAPPFREAFAAASWRPGPLRSYSQAGLVNNLNDALAWGLVPLYLAADGASVEEIGLVAGIYPAVWAVAQIATGAWSDRVGRRLPIVGGMLVQAAALCLLAAGGGDIVVSVCAAVLLGLGTALVYPTLIAAISDEVSPVARAPIVGVYRFWRDSGYVVGALLAGLAADGLGFEAAIGIVAALTAASGLWVAVEASPPGYSPDGRSQRRSAPARV